MLDAHPALSIPPETDFVPAAASLAVIDPSPSAFVALLTQTPTWRDFGIGADEVAERTAAIVPFDVAAATRAFYELYAQRHGKPRWGDKTPGYLGSIPEIWTLLPEAHFVHIIRDGRAVAASMRNMPFAPGDGSINSLARSWRDQILGARSRLTGEEPYLEIHYEDLVTAPEAELRRICAFIGLPYDERSLDYHRSAGERLAELTDFHAGGRLVMTGDARVAAVREALGPPDPSRIAGWQADLGASERRTFEATAGDLLEELGY